MKTFPPVVLWPTNVIIDPSEDHVGDHGAVDGPAVANSFSDEPSAADVQMEKFFEPASLLPSGDQCGDPNKLSEGSPHTDVQPGAMIRCAASVEVDATQIPPSLVKASDAPSGENRGP